MVNELMLAQALSLDLTPKPAEHDPDPQPIRTGRLRTRPGPLRWNQEVFPRVGGGVGRLNVQHAGHCS
jgi:hypothetical protein